MDTKLAKHFLDACRRAKKSHTKEGWLKKPYQRMKLTLGKTLRVGDYIIPCEPYVRRARIVAIAKVRIHRGRTGTIIDFDITYRHKGRNSECSWMHCCSVPRKA